MNENAKYEVMQATDAGLVSVGSFDSHHEAKQWIKAQGSNQTQFSVVGHDDDEAQDPPEAA